MRRGGLNEASSACLEGRPSCTASVAQLAEQLICNQQVAGSSPAAGSSGASKSALLIGPIVHWKLEPITRMTREHCAFPVRALCASRQVQCAGTGLPIRMHSLAATAARSLARLDGSAASPLGHGTGDPWQAGQETGGEVPERSKGSDCKSDGSAFTGSNPVLPTIPWGLLLGLWPGQGNQRKPARGSSSPRPSFMRAISIGRPRAEQRRV